MTALFFLVMSKKTYYGAFDKEQYADLNELGVVGAFFEGLWNDISGKSAQSMEFEQQEELLQKEQDFADERNRMQRMIEAGINPNTAAAGIAGTSSNPSAPAVSNNTSGAAQGLDALNNAVGSPALQKFSEGLSNLFKMEPEKQNILADTKLKLEQAGWTSEDSERIGILNTYLPEEKRLGLLQLEQMIKNLGKQYDLYDAQIDLFNGQIRQIDQQIKESEASISLMEMQKLVQQKQSLLLEQQTFEIQWQNNVRNQIGLDPTLGLENNLFILSFRDRTKYNQCMDILGGINYKRFSGQYTADEETAYRRARREAEGRFSGQSEYLPVFTMIDDLNQVFMDFRSRAFISPERMQELCTEMMSKMQTLIDNQK